MKNIQFGRMDDKMFETLESLKLSLGVELKSFPSNKQFLQFMIDATEEKLNACPYLVFGFDAENPEGGILDMIGQFKEIPETDNEIVQVYDVVKKVVL